MALYLQKIIEKRGYKMKKLLYLVTFLVITVILSAQMPPHPDLLKKVENGSIDKPFVLKNWKEIKEKGVSSGWTSEGLKKKNAAIQNKEEIDRIYGPENVVSGTFNAIFLFVEFTDQTDTVSVSFFDNLLFSTSSGSMRDFYSKVSYGNLDLTTVDMPSTIGWVTAPKTYAYYVDGQNGFGSYPANAQGLAEDIVELVDPAIDFSPYDNDGDGYIDALFIVHTGPGAEFSGSGDDIWSHAWSIPGGGYLTDDGVRAQRYSMEPEYWANPGDMTVGVYVHEMGHSVFGLPDVYDTDYSSSGVGSWSLMAGGSWNGSLGNSPAWPDAWCHIQMGYVTPTVVTSDLTNETITSMSSQPDVYKLWKDGSPGNEYFLVQNRQKVGYDSGLPGDGLLIWHVDETQSGNTNEWYPGHTSSGNYLLALEQADGDWDLEKDNNGGDPFDSYPGNLNVTQFNFSTTPNSNSYDDVITNVSVENISASGTNMTADLLVSAQSVYLQVTSPNGGETWEGGSEQTVEWSSNGITDISIELSTDAGSTWTDVETTYDASSAQYTWTVPNTPSTECLVKVTDLNDTNNVDESNNTFEITAAPEILVVSPNGGEDYQGGEEIEVTWTSTNIENVKIEYSNNNGTDWENVIFFTSSDGSYMWTLPSDVTSSECLVRISDLQNGSIVDESDNTFSITSNTLSAPNLLAPLNDEIDLESSVDFSWDPVANADSYTLIISTVPSFSTIFHEENGINSEAITLDLFAEGAKYYWSVYAVGTIGNGPSSSVFNFTTKLSPPDSLKAISYAHTPNQVILTWNDNSDNESGYLVERMGLDMQWAQAAMLGPDTETWSETIQDPQNYTYRVKAYTNQAESEYSNEAGVVLSSVNNDDAVPAEYTLAQNYPNPFNPSTQIKFGLPFESNVNLKIFNILGQTVAELANETMQSGYHTIEWNAGNLTSGIYFYSIEASSVSGENTFNSVKKMLLVK